MANPQLHNGHTQIANEILDALRVAPFLSAKSRVLLCILRETYGRVDQGAPVGPDGKKPKKKSDRMSYKQLGKWCGLPPRTVKRVMTDLKDKQVVTVEGKRGCICEIGFQKDYDLWEVVPELAPVPEVAPVSELTPTGARSGTIIPQRKALPKKRGTPHKKRDGDGTPKDKEPDPRVAVLVTYFFDKQTARLGEEPATFSGGRLASFVKERLDKGAAEADVQRRMDAHFARDTPFLRQKGWACRWFMEDYDGLKPELQGGQSSSQTTAPPDLDDSLREDRERDAKRPVLQRS